MKRSNLTCVPCVAAIVLAAGATVSVAQPLTVNGTKESQYGSAKWVNTLPTGFGDNASTPCDNTQPGSDPAAVTTGLEMAIPLSAIGNPTGDIKIVVFINGGGHDYASNQFLPGLTPFTGNLGGDGSGGFNGTLSGVNLATIPGTQSATIATNVTVATPPTLDGTKDAVYGVPIALNNNRTGFGNANNGSPSNSNGSELNGLYAVVSGGTLYLLATGNFEGNGNKVEIFIDSVAGGQNVIQNVGFPFDRLQGLTFEPGFDADYWFGPNNFAGTFYLDAATIGSPGSYAGSVAAGGPGGVFTGGSNPDNIAGAMNNSNIAGVDGPCPPPAGNADTANGSELDALYSYIDTTNNRLYLIVTGNLETGFGGGNTNSGNKLNLFFDVAPGGQGTLRADNVDISFGNLNRMGPNLTAIPATGGLTFDAGFEADYWMSVKNNNAAGPVNQVLDCAVLRTAGPRKVPFSSYHLDYGGYDGGPKNNPNYNPVTFRGFNPNDGSTPTVDPDIQAADGSTDNIYTSFGPRDASDKLVFPQTGPNYFPPFNTPTSPDPLVGTPGLISLSINNSNIAGVTGSAADQAAALAVSTGIEISVDLRELGWDGRSAIRVAGFITSEDASYPSNQVLGDPPSNPDNMGSYTSTSGINFDVNTAFPGKQYVVLRPAGCNPADIATEGDSNLNAGPDGFITGTDFDAYVQAFFTEFVSFAGVQIADIADQSTQEFTPDGFITGVDFDAFIVLFFQGC
ncbi:MAG: hypothetical protein KIT68_05615 [Phycisphaeraceae bacterium]|nr:hypothetical protein [Phycisphaeraceae bacterium]